MTDLRKELVQLPGLLSHEVLDQLLAVFLMSLNKYCLFKTNGEVNWGM